MAIPVKENLIIYQGSTYVHRIPVTVDSVVTPLTGYTGRMQIRSSISSDTVLYDSTTDGDITIEASTAIVTLEIPGATSAAWDWTSGFYDIEIESPDGKPYRLLDGRVKVKPEVTR